MATLAPNILWYSQGNTAILRNSITEIEITKSYQSSGLEDSSWDASQELDGSVIAYINQAKLTIQINDSVLYANPDSRQVFYGNYSDSFQNCEKLSGLELLDVTKAQDLTGFFCNMQKVKELNVSGFNTLEAQSIAGMFYNCYELTELNIDNFNTSKVTSMNSMFRGCKKLTKINPSHWDTSNVMDMSYMFYNCQQLKSLDLHLWDTSKVTSMKYQFACSSASGGYGGTGHLQDIDVSNWDVSSCEDMSGMFQAQLDLKQIAIETWTGTSSCTNMGWMFWTCPSLKIIDLSNFDTKNVISMHHLFAHDTGLIEIKGLDKLNLESCITVNAMLHSTAIKKLDISKWNTSKVEDFSQFMEYNSTITEIIGLDKIDTSNVKACGQMFNGCSNLRRLDLSTFNTLQVSANWIDPYRNAQGMGIADMFTGLQRLEKIILGQNFSFNGDGTLTAVVLPTPNASLIENADGKWHKSNGDSYLPSNIPSKTQGSYYANSKVKENFLVNGATLLDLVLSVKSKTNFDKKITIKDAISNIENLLI